MAFNILITDEAQQDILSAYLYYEEQQTGLGERFLSELAYRYKDLSVHPQYYSFLAADTTQRLRKLKLPHFPYIILYQVINDDVIIHAVHNYHKNMRRFSGGDK